MSHLKKRTVLIIGGGPAGLIAAERVIAHRTDVNVILLDAMPSVGRKFLLAGIGGMNITHSEPFTKFCARYREKAHWLTPLLREFGPEELRTWIHDLGIETFIGTSGRVFPKEMKAAPLLRAWLSRLRKNGLEIRPRHRWRGWDAQGNAIIESPEGTQHVAFDAMVLALGGASWPKLGSDGLWQTILREKGVNIAPLAPANCGFLSKWSAQLKNKFAGAPLKSVAITVYGAEGHAETKKGEFVLTEAGVEGSLIYAFSATLREQIRQKGKAQFYLDLLPDHSEQDLVKLIAKRSSKKTLSAFFENSLKLAGVRKAIAFEFLTDTEKNNPALLAALLKKLPITLYATTPIAEAISSAGGIETDELSEQLMLKKLPGVFCAGEMLDWEAPTGGYLLTACFSTGARAGDGAARYLKNLSD